MQLRNSYVVFALAAGCSAAPSGDNGESLSATEQAVVSGSAPNQCVASPDKPSTDTGWSRGLTVGPNGPIPVIVVDQFGYRRHDAKVAVIRDPQIGYDSAVDFTPGPRYAVVNKATGAIVKRGAPTAWNGGATDPSTGDKAWWFDFSDVTRPGTYTVVDIERGMRSVEFEIDDDVYRSVLRHAVRMYFYQRAGFAKTAETVGAEWADGASHLGPRQDSEAHSWHAPSDETLVKDLRGGWFDAGDYNKYTSWTAHNVRNLLRAYEENPAIFSDDFGIAESHNGVPDILDEAKWGLDWVVRMQNDDGSLLSILGLAKGSPPSSATGPSYYGPASTSATLSGALSFAYASRVYGRRPEPAFRAYAAELAARAKKAWDWAEANPDVRYYNNDGELQPGSDGLGGGQQETDDDGRLFDKLEAAIYLYEITGGAKYKSFVEANYATVLPIGIPTIWGADKQDAVLYYSQLKGVSKRTRSSIVSQFLKNILEKPDQFPTATAGGDPYLSPLSAYYWGSNFTKAQQGRVYELLAQFTKDKKIAKQAMTVAEGYLHYIHGVNPLGLVYLTNMKRAGAEHSAKTTFHFWFTDGSPRWDEVSDTTPGPAPGYLLGGPTNWYAVDSCCTDPPGSWDYQCNDPSLLPLCNLNYTPPLGQPDQKMYLQFNMDTPGDSYIVTEASTGYQAEFILFLSRFID
ncbi:MAG TPA: glycoside hydrolase family 9 protein [Polyangiaceae bacterium]|jgi:hypothetical protein|nr:glycoside hydrolase family 9 protein [Polyangiaceae bacterium]